MLWVGACLAPEPIYDIFVFDSLNAIGCGGDFDFGVSVIKTTNSGVNWQYVKLGIFGKGEAVSFRTRGEGWIGAGFSSKLVYTFDSARTWREIFTPDTNAVYDLVFADSYHGYAVGYNGLILKYNTATIGIGNISENIPSEFVLHQNYPNPFNIKSKIKYQTSKKSSVKIQVFDVLGQLLETLENTERNPGEFELEFDGEEFPSGIYYYRLQAGDFSETKKMVLLK